MSKNILIAQVGSGKYKSIEYTVFTGCNEEHSVYYADDGGSPQEASIEAKFSFYAIYQKLRLSGRVDALVLVGTKTSSWYTLCENMKEISGAEGEIRLSDLTDGMDGKNPCISNIENPTKREKTEDFLSQCLNGTEVKLVIQEFGILPEESKQNFHVLQETLSRIMDAPGENESNEEVHLYLDISNGFRSFPVYLFLWTSYMAQMRPNRPIRLFVYYGMFDCKMRQEGNIFLSDWEGKFVPLIRMDDATDIMQWTNAVAEFYSNGSVTQMKRLLGKGKG